MPVQSHFLDMAFTSALTRTHTRGSRCNHASISLLSAQAYGHSCHFALGTALQERPERLRAAQKSLDTRSNTIRFGEPVQSVRNASHTHTHTHTQDGSQPNPSAGITDTSLYV